MKDAVAGANISAPNILHEYALLADGERGVLVGHRVAHVWMCFPRWDSGACFAALIGGNGTYAVTPDARHVWGGYYELGLIWRSRWITDTGVIECREALALPSREDRAVILRRIVARRGRARLNVVLDLCSELEPAKRVTRHDDGVWSAQIGDASARWAGAADAQPRADGHGAEPLVMQLKLEEGDVHDLVLVLDCGSQPDPAPDPDRLVGHRSRLARAGTGPRLPRGAPRCASLLRGAGGADQRRRRDGRRGHDVASRARP